MQAIANIKQEEAYLHEQDRMLSGKQARPAIAIELQKNGDAWGYVIKGAGILLSTLEVAAGIGLAATGTPVGILFGAAIMAYGVNDLQESINDLKGKSNNTGFLKNGFIGTAEFLGFSPEVGRMAYHSVSIVLSGYGILRYTLKPDAWRLFRYINSDYVRNFNNMSRLDLGIEIYNDVNALNSIRIEACKK